EVRRDDDCTNQAADRFGNADDDFEYARETDELSGQDGERAHPEQYRDRCAHARVVAPLEKVADGLQVVLGRETSNARSDGQGENGRADRRRPDPPPGCEAVSVAETRGVDRGPAADVGGKEGRKQQAWPEAPPGNEEVAGHTHAPRDPRAQRDLRG